MAVIEGTSGADSLLGTSDPDTITGLNGNDTIDGDDGDDSLDGGVGLDILFGGLGADTVIGGDGSDTLFGEEGDDNVNGRVGNDSIDGGSGNDILEGSNGNDTVHGGIGNDVVGGGSNDDLLTGGDGQDSLNGSNGSDTLDGGDGDDSLDAGGDDLFDILIGGIGNDQFSRFGRGGDSGDAGEGDDTVRVELVDTTTSTLTLGGGADTIILSASATTSRLVVSDFDTGAGGDLLDLSSVLSALTGWDGVSNPFDPGQGFFRLRQDGADVVLDIDHTGGGDGFIEKVRFENKTVGSFTSSSFVPDFDPNPGFVNTAPTAQDDAVGAAEDGPATLGDVLADNGFGADSDIDLDTLTVSAVNGSAMNVGDQIALASGALLTVNGDGTFSYDANSAFENLGAGDTALDSFTYEISDGNGGTDTATVSVTVDGANDGPLAQDDTVGAAEDGPATFGDVLADNGFGADSDIDLDTLTVSAVNGSAMNVGDQIALASGALLTVNGDGTFSYDANSAFENLGAGDTALDSFTYEISDGNGGTDTATLSVTVDGANDAPDAKDDGFVTDEVTPVAASLFADNGSGEDSDIDFDTLTVTAVNGSAMNVGGQITLVSGALLTVNGDGTFSYDANGIFDDLSPGDVALDSFTYSIADAEGAADTATATITVNGIVSSTPTGGDDDIAGTSAADVIDALNGNDTVDGLDGDDSLIGGAGTDSLSGGADNDTIFGGTSPDTISGGLGNDVLDGGTAFDTLDYSDRADGGVNVNVINGVALTGGFINSAGFYQGGAQEDTISNFENIFGTSFGDRLIAGSTSASISGFGGDDFLFTFSGNDTLFGGEGNDFISTANSTDQLFGENGNDTLNGGTGFDTLNGGADSDTADYSARTGGVSVNLISNVAITGGALNMAGFYAGGFTEDSLVSIENIIGSNFGDRLVGLNAGSRIDGRGGNDNITTFSGADTLIGGAGNDTLAGGAGNDLFEFATGFGADRITDFAEGVGAGDVIRLVGLGAAFDSFAEVIAAASQSGGDVVFNFGGGNTITVASATVAGFAADDFSFG